MDNPIAANVLGTMGAVCWSIQLIPQIIVNYRRQHTTGLQPTMMLLWATAGIPLGVYNILKEFNTALLIQPQILTFLSLLTWVQCKYYGDGGDDVRRWKLMKCIVVVAILNLFMGSIEVAMYFALREATKRDIEWPAMLMAILAAILLAAGVARHYWDIYKERTVRGISFVFVGIDALGDLTSLISILFQPRLDILGLVIYGTELILWLGVFACGGWYNFRPWLKSMKRRWNLYAVTKKEHQGEQRCTNPTVHLDTQDTSSLSSSSTRTVFRTASSHGSVQGVADLETANIRLRTVVPGE